MLHCARTALLNTGLLAVKTPCAKDLGKKEHYLLGSKDCDYTSFVRFQPLQRQQACLSLSNICCETSDVTLAFVTCCLCMRTCFMFCVCCIVIVCAISLFVSGGSSLLMAHAARHEAAKMCLLTLGVVLVVIILDGDSRLPLHLRTASTLIRALVICQ